MISTIKNACQNYYDQIPPDTLRKGGLSALYSFAFNVSYLGVNTTSSLMSSGVAFTATIIYSIIAPIFRWLFGDGKLFAHRELPKFLVQASIIEFGFKKIGFSSWLMASENLILSSVDLFPLILDTLGMNHQAVKMRNSYHQLGLGVVSDSASLNIVFKTI